MAQPHRSICQAPKSSKDPYSADKHSVTLVSTNNQTNNKSRCGKVYEAPVFNDELAMWYLRSNTSQGEVTPVFYWQWTVLNSGQVGVCPTRLGTGLVVSAPSLGQTRFHKRKKRYVMFDKFCEFIINIVKVPCADLRNKSDVDNAKTL